MAVLLSDDHKPTNPDEKDRITRAGGFVQNGRVNGILSLSRAFGDFAFKDMTAKPENMAITCVPEIIHVELEPQD